jgi:TolA-binding protein
MAAHSSDASIHFTGISTKLLAMAKDIATLKRENTDLKSKAETISGENEDLDSRLGTLEETIETLEETMKSMEEQIETLEEENRELQQEVNNVYFTWKVLEFDMRNEFNDESPGLFAFGHTLCLALKKEGDDSVKVMLYMSSRISCWLGYKFYVGRADADEGSEHVWTVESSDLVQFPIKDDVWGYHEIVPSDILTTDKLLTPEGDLYIAVSIYKAKVDP